MISAAMNFIMRIVRAGRSPLNFMFQKPAGSGAAKRFNCNDQKIASECSEKNCGC